MAGEGALQKRSINSEFVGYSSLYSAYELYISRLAGLVAENVDALIENKLAAFFCIRNGELCLTKPLVASGGKAD